MLFRALGDTWGQFLVLWDLGYMARRQGDNSEATTRYQESLALARAMGIRGLPTRSASWGRWRKRWATTLRRRRCWRRAWRCFRSWARRANISWLLFSLGNITRRQGDNTRAIAHFAECLAWFREPGDIFGIAACLEGIAQVAIAIAQPVPAVQLFGAAAAIRDAIGHPPYPDEQHEYDRLLAAAREQLGEDAFAAAWAAGRALTLEQAIAEALAISSASPDWATS